MSNYLYIKNRILNLSYLVEAVLEVVNGENRSQRSYQVVIFLNHPIPDRQKVTIPFETESSAKEFLYYVLNALSDNNSEDEEGTPEPIVLSDDETVEI